MLVIIVTKCKVEIGTRERYRQLIGYDYTGTVEWCLYDDLE